MRITSAGVTCPAACRASPLSLTLSTTFHSSFLDNLASSVPFALSPATTERIMQNPNSSDATFELAKPYKTTSNVVGCKRNVFSVGSNARYRWMRTRGVTATVDLDMNSKPGSVSQAMLFFSSTCPGPAHLSLVRHTLPQLDFEK